MIKKSIFLLLFTLFFINSAAAQRRLSDVEYARRLEHAQEFERALAIYSRLYNNGNKKFDVTNGIIRCYYGLRQYRKLIDFLHELIKANPRRYDLKIDIGRAYYMNNQKEKALQTWNDVIKSPPADIMKYRFTASAMAQLHLFDEAIDVYKQALKKFKGQETMYRDIALLYRNQLDYAEAAHYLLKYYNHFKKRYNDFYMQIMYIIADKEALPPVIGEFEKYLAENSDKKISELLGGLYLRNDQTAKAYDIYEKLYARDKNVRHLLNFAREAELKHEYLYAVKAYREALSAAEQQQTASEIKYNLARNYYYLAKTDNVENSNNYISQSLKLLDELSVDTKYGTFKIKAMELRGDIYLHYFNDLDKAAGEYKNIIKIENNNRIKERILLKLANVYFLKNDLDKSRKIYDEIKGKQNLVYALYQKGNLEYYRGKFSEAHKLYDQALSKAGLRDSLSNNILEQIMMLTRFSADSAVLARYSNAERLEKQGRKSQAAEKYYAVFSEGKDIGALAGIKSARLLQQIGKNEEAVKVLREFTQVYADADNSDEAWYLLGQYESRLKNYDEALQAYQKILDDFPTSFYLDRARENAREITQLKSEEVN